MATSGTRAPLAFINLPYSRRYEKVYLAFIAGVAGYGLVPTAAVRDPASNYQLERIFNLISAADYSFHDLSWMALDNKRPRTPRLNMALELGLAVAITKCTAPQHQWFVFDTLSYRLDKALSDLGGIRPRIHDRTPRSVLRALMNALTREKHQPTLGNLLLTNLPLSPMRLRTCTSHHWQAEVPDGKIPIRGGDKCPDFF